VNRARCALYNKTFKKEIRKRIRQESVNFKATFCNLPKLKSRTSKTTLCNLRSTEKQEARDPLTLDFPRVVNIFSKDALLNKIRGNFSLTKI